MIDLRAWIRRAPKPRRLRIMVDGEERIVDISQTATRGRWHEVEQTLRSSGAEKVEALDENGTILRSTRLAPEEVNDESETEARERIAERREGRSNRELATMLDAYGHRMVAAFDAGAKCASASSEPLVAIVDTLARHLSTAIGNLHAVSTNMANLTTSHAEQVARLLASASEESGGGSDRTSQLLALLLASANPNAAAAVAGMANGAEKGKKS